MKKRSIVLTSIVLTIMLLATLLAGCASNEDKTPSEPSATPSEETPSEDTPESSEPGKVTVSVFDRGNTGGTDPTDNYWTDWIKENALADENLDVTFISIPRSEEVDRLNVLMAANQAPDISMTYNKSVMFNYYMNGGLADLTDSLANYGQELAAYLGDEILEYGQIDGKQVAIPAKRISRAVTTMWIRKDWLDAVGMDIPTTKQEFRDALMAFKEQNPGNVEGVIPFQTWSDMPWAISPIVNSFINLDVSDEELYVNAAIGEFILLDGFKEGIRFVNGLFNDGLMDPQFPLYRDNQTPDENVMRGLVGAYSHNYDYPLRTSPNILNNLLENVPTAEFVPFHAFENAKGEYVNSIYEPIGIYLFTPKANDNADNAVKYLNWLSMDKARIFLAIGEEGVHHTLDEDGLPVMQNVEGEKIMNSPNNIDYANVVNGTDLGNPEKNIQILSKSYDLGFEDLFMEAYRVSTQNGFNLPSLMTPIEAEGQYANVLIDHKKEFLALAITASVEDFDRVFDQGVQEYLAMGAQEILEERQAAWDAQN